jgi:hypothetical protein
VRRFTLLTLIVLFVLIIIAAVFQLLAARGPRHLPGPIPGTPLPTASSP